MIKNRKQSVTTVFKQISWNILKQSLEIKWIYKVLMHSYQRSSLCKKVGLLSSYSIGHEENTRPVNPVPCLTRLVIAISDFKENLLVESWNQHIEEKFG